MFEINKFDEFRQRLLESQTSGIICIAHTHDPRVDGSDMLQLYRAAHSPAREMSLLQHYLSVTGNIDLFLAGIKEIGDPHKPVS